MSRDAGITTSAGREPVVSTVAFTCDSPAPRVVFGVGALDALPTELDRLGAVRVLLLSTPGRHRARERVATLLGSRLAGEFDQARAHVPAEVVDEAFAKAADLRADLCVTLGGGSATGLGKAVARAGGPPVLAIPTTYAGSEMTTIWGISARGNKTTGRDPRVLPRTVLYDPLLTVDMPAGVSGPSGMNAIAHCVEALYAPDATPLSSLMAAEGIRTLAASLPVVVRSPASLEARSTALMGAWLAGGALGATTMGLHHRLCHVLGGTFGLPHAETHSVILPHATAHNAPAAADAMTRAARALGGSDVPGLLFDLAGALGIPRSLRELGMREDELDRAAALSTASPVANPRAATTEEVRALLGNAFHGRRPAAATTPAGSTTR